MNFLAHLYLSGNDSEIQFGNFIGDWVKGKQFEKYPDKIKQGILLHRNIDTFIDTHQISLCSIKRMRPIYGKYAGIVIDILYDHYLASNWENYSEISLKKYSSEFKKNYLKHKKYLPEKAQHFAPFFILKNRLLCYSNFKCFGDVLLAMSKYTSLPNKKKEAMLHITENYLLYKSEFEDFFELIIKQLGILK